MAWNGPTIYESADLTVETAPSDHTVPCLAYALVERGGWHPDGERLEKGDLRPGKWVSEALRLLREDAPPDTVLEIGGGRFPLGVLAENYFVQHKGARTAFVTDTAWSEAVKPGLLRLAQKAQRLYCDSYYAQAQAKQAAQHRHMTATHAAEFAKAARVEKLILMHFGPRYAGCYPNLVEEARTIFPRVSAIL